MVSAFWRVFGVERRQMREHVAKFHGVPSGKPSGCREVILPLTVLRQLDCICMPTTGDLLAQAGGQSLYNMSKHRYSVLLADRGNVAQNFGDWCLFGEARVRNDQAYPEGPAPWGARTQPVARNQRTPAVALGRVPRQQGWRTSWRLFSRCLMSFLG